MDVPNDILAWMFAAPDQRAIIEKYPTSRIQPTVKGGKQQVAPPTTGKQSGGAKPAPVKAPTPGPTVPTPSPTPGPRTSPTPGPTPVPVPTPVTTPKAPSYKMPTAEQPVSIKPNYSSKTNNYTLDWSGKVEYGPDGGIRIPADLAPPVTTENNYVNPPPIPSHVEGTRAWQWEVSNPPPVQPRTGYRWVVKTTYINGVMAPYWTEERISWGNPQTASTPDSSGGYGGGGGSSGGGDGEDEAEMLGELAWWENADSIQPLLRGWASWLKELVESNRPSLAIPNPLWFDPEAEEAAEGIEQGTPMPGYKSSMDVLNALKEKLGLSFEEGESATSRWQKFINAIPQADFESQQLLASLRFDPNNARWYSVDIGQLVNPKYT